MPLAVRTEQWRVHHLARSIPPNQRTPQTTCQSRSHDGCPDTFRQPRASAYLMRFNNDKIDKIGSTFGSLGAGGRLPKTRRGQRGFQKCNSASSSSRYVSCFPPQPSRGQSAVEFLLEGSRILGCPKRTPSTARPLSRGPWPLGSDWIAVLGMDGNLLLARSERIYVYV